MELQNGYSGIKKIFTGEILQLVAALLMFLSTLFAVAIVVIPAAAGLLALAVLGVTIISGLIALIGLIFYYVGVGTAAKDSSKFKVALIFLLVGILLSIVGTIFGVLTKLSWGGLVESIVGIISSVMQLCALVFVIGGIQEFAEQKGDLKVQGMCKTYRILLLIFYILIILADVLGFVFGLVNVVAAIVASAISLIASLLSIVQYFLYLALLARAKQMLAAPSAIQAAPAQEQPSPVEELASEEEPAIQEEPKNEDKE